MEKIDVDRLTAALDIVNSNAPVGTRREHEFNEIKEVLKKYKPLEAAHEVVNDKDYYYCPICHEMFGFDLFPVPFQKFCYGCGQLIKYSCGNN